MTRRSRKSGKQANPHRRKAEMPKRPIPAKAMSGRRSTATQETETARLSREREEGALEQLSAASQVLQVNSSRGDLRPVFNAILKNAVRICEANFGNLFLWDGKALELAAMLNAPPALAEFLNRRGRFLPTPGVALDRLLKTKQLVHSLDEAAQSVPSASARLAGARTMLVVPILKEQDLIGTVAIYRTEGRAFTDKQIALVQNFAAQAVIAIENARLLNELRESLERQTATADILRVIASTPEDSKRALDTIAETASQMFDAANVNLRRLEGDILRVVGSAGPSVVRIRASLPDLPLEPTDPAMRSLLDNK